jgi:hypothetical protein
VRARLRSSKDAPEDRWPRQVTFEHPSIALVGAASYIAG